MAQVQVESSTKAIEPELDPKVPKVNTNVRFDRLFQQDRHRGRIESAHGGRLIFTPSDLLSLLQTAVEETAQEGDSPKPTEFLYQLGLQLGKNSFRSFVYEIKESASRRLEDLNCGYLLESWWWSWRTKGFGRAGFDLQYVSHGHFLVRVDQVSEHPIDRTMVLPFYCGLFASVFTMIANRPLDATQLSQADSDLFVVGPAKRLKLVKLWRDGGLSSEDILERLTDVVVVSSID